MTTKEIKEVKKLIVIGALDAAFSGYGFELKRLRTFATDFIEHLEGIHKWRILPPIKKVKKASRTK